MNPLVLLAAIAALIRPVVDLQQAEPAFSKEQLEQLVAPIALHPDSWLTQILMASTYPLEVVEAHRWVQKDPKRTGKALEEALKEQDWDPSVKSLCGFPTVLKQMNDNLDWTQDLGDAFLAQKAELMDGVQRMRKNELMTIATLHEYVEAQREYRSTGRDGNPPAYARAVFSGAGKHDGLFWPAAPGEPESPLGPLVAAAAEEGYRKDESPAPYHGYLFRTLAGQGKGAPGGEKSYLDEHGLLTHGFALLAWPAKYGSSGVMTFLVGEHGLVYQKDLGRDTAALVARIDGYAPDASWDPTAD